MGIFKSNFFPLTPKLAKRAAAFINVREMTEKTIAPNDGKENETSETTLMTFLRSKNINILNTFYH